MVASSFGTTAIWVMAHKYYNVAHDLDYVLNKKPVSDKSCCKKSLVFWLVALVGIVTAVCQTICNPIQAYSAIANVVF
jgi:hypothetical protein